jgi:hypothetical protein
MNFFKLHILIMQSLIIKVEQKELTALSEVEYFYF